MHYRLGKIPLSEIVESRSGGPSPGESCLIVVLAIIAALILSGVVVFVVVSIGRAMQWPAEPHRIYQAPPSPPRSGPQFIIDGYGNRGGEKKLSRSSATNQASIGTPLGR